MALSKPASFIISHGLWCWRNVLVIRKWVYWSRKMWSIYWASIGAFCRSQMNLCMPRTRYDVSMEREFIEEKEAYDRVRTSFASEISQQFIKSDRSRMKLKRSLILIRLNSRKALPFLLLHCCTIESSLSLRKSSFERVKRLVKLDYERHLMIEGLITWNWILCVPFFVPRWRWDRNRNCFNCSEQLNGFSFMYPELHVFCVWNALQSTPELQIGFSACCHLIIDQTNRD